MEGSYRVETSVLAAAAGVLASLSTTIGDAREQVSSAADADFGGESVGDAFATACNDAERALRELSETVDTLSRNAAAAADGYLVTDQGAVPIAALHRYGGLRP